MMKMSNGGLDCGEGAEQHVADVVGMGVRSSGRLTESLDAVATAGNADGVSADGRLGERVNAVAL